MKQKPAPLRDLKRLASVPFSDGNFRDVMDSLKSESDRAMMIISGSLLEDELQGRIKHALVPLSKDDSKRFFGIDGLAGTFSSKILMSFSLGLIDAHTRDLLEIIRELRNACAHSRVPVSFDTPEVQKAAHLLFPHELRGSADRQKIRAQFLMVCSLLLTIIVSGKSEQSLKRIKTGIDRVYAKVNDSI